MRKSVHFRRPKTQKLPRNPKYPRKSVAKRNKYVLILILGKLDGMCGKSCIVVILFAEWTSLPL